jgi:hypothetical protein
VRHHRPVLRQRLFVLASWAVTTMVATLVCAAGVSIVTRDVTAPHNPTLGQADVVALLSAPVPTAAPSPTVTAGPPPTDTAPPPAPTAVPAPPPTPPPPQPRPQPAPPATTEPPSTKPPLLAGALTATFSVEGGTITVACLGDQIALVSARSNDGYRFVVLDERGDRVSVRFARDGSDRDRADELESVCLRGEPVLADGQDPRWGRDRTDGDHSSGGGDDGGAGELIGDDDSGGFWGRGSGPTGW